MGTAVLSLAMVAGVVVAATRNEGYRATQVDLHEAGVWVTERSMVGRINTEIAEIEVGVPRPSLVDVVQDGDLAFAVSAGGEASAIQALDAAGERLSEQAISIPEGAEVHLAGGTLAVVDPAAGRLWFGPAAGGGLSTAPESAVPDLEGDGALVVAVGVDGQVHAYRAGDREVRSFSPAAGVGAEPLVRPVPALAEPRITAVGSHPVLLDRDGGGLVVVGGGSATVPVTPDLILQQPGPDSSGVLVAGGGRLLEVPVAGGAPRTLSAGAGGGAVAPVRAGGCAYGAWEAEATYARVCDRTLSGLGDIGSGEAKRLPEADFAPGGDLEWRVNRGRAVLNDVLNGPSLLADLDVPKVVRDWAKVKPPKKDDGDEATGKLSDRDCAEAGSDQAKLQVEPVVRGTRPGRPVLVPLVGFDLVEADPCDSPMVELTGAAPASGEAQVVAHGTAIQVTPAPGATTVDVAFQVRGLWETVPGSLRVEVHDSGNQAPEAVPDRSIGVVDATVTHDVLRNDTDPEGDPLRLVSVVGPSERALPRFRADGTVTVETGSEPGPVEFTYTVADDQGKEHAGALTVDVQAADAQNPPNPAPDQVVVAVGARVEVDVLANDIDIDTPHEQLRLTAAPADASLGLTRPQTDHAQGSGVLALEPTVAGEYKVPYTVTDGTTPRESLLRVKVVERTEGNRSPVAVRDQVAVRENVPAVVDVLRNDVDPDGDLLAVTSIDLDAAPDVSAEIIGLRLVRIIAPRLGTQAVDVRYTVSDGSRSHTGTIVVVPYESRVSNQDPLAVDDSATVRAGQWLAVDVVANDVDPEGEQLTVAKVDTPLDEGQPQGRVFHRGPEVRFRPDPDVRGTVRIPYEVADPEGRRNGGEVVVTVVDPEEPNRPPRADVRVQGRVRVGEPTLVAFPLLSMDPDGDVVSILNVNPDRAPGLGSAEIDGEGLLYTAEEDSTGTDRFAVFVSDGDLAHDPVAVEVEVVVVGRPTEPLPPLAVPDHFTVREGAEERELDVLGNDRDPDAGPDGGEVTLVVDGDLVPRLSGEGNGTLRVQGGRVFYRPPTTIDGEVRDVSFSYTVADASGLTATGLARITVTKGTVNRAPVALDDLHAPVLAGDRVIIDVLANDRDPDDPAFPDGFRPEILDSDTVREARVLADGRIQVVPGDRSVKFAYQVVDDDDAAAEAIVVVPVVGSLAPVANPDETSVDAGQTVEIDVLANDTPRAELELDRLVQGSVRGGQARIAPGGTKIAFTAGSSPLEGGFSYVVRNVTSGRLAVGRARVTVVADEQNRPPTLALPARLVLTADDPALVLELSELARDPDEDDVLTFGVVGQPGGEVEASLAGSRLSLRVPNEDAAAAIHTLTVQVTDADGESVTDDTTVEVRPGSGPTPPVAVDDLGRETRAGEPIEIDVVANDQWADGEEPVLQPTLTRLAGGGQARVAGRTITYTPVDGDRVVRLQYALTDTYRRTDGSAPPDRVDTAVLEITVYTRPGKPQPPNGEATSKAVRLRWTPPPDNGLGITGYVVEGRDLGTGATTRQTATTAQHEFGGLTNGSRYCFRVAAFNDRFPASEVEDAHFSDCSQEFRPDKRPDAPDSPTVRFDKDDNDAAGGVLHVSWTAPFNEGSDITGYRLESDGAGPWTLGPGQTSLRVTGLTNGTTYRFRVIATNAQGDSDPSPYSAADPYNSVPAAPPLAASITSVQQLPPEISNTVAVTVVFAPGSDRGAEQTFVVRTDAGQEAPGTPAGTVIRDLDGGRDYSFTVTATNKAGETVSPAVSYRGYGRPAAPANVRIANEGDREITIAWDVVSVTGGGSVTYTVHSNHRGPQSVGSVTTWTDTGLANGTPYTYWVTASNTGGNESGDSNQVTANPYGVPRVTGLSAGDPGQTSITWSWSADPNGRPITSFAWTLSNGASGTSAGTTVTTGGLNPGTNYRFCVAPTNLRGAGAEVCGEAATDPLPPDFSLSLSTTLSPPDDLGLGCGDGACYRVNINYLRFNGRYTYSCYGVAGLTFDFTVAGDGQLLSYCAWRSGQPTGITIWGPGLPAEGLTR